MNQILSTLFMNEENSCETNFCQDECQKALKNLDLQLDHIKDLYMTEGKKNKMSLSTNVSVFSN